jgi:hypothetical protein
MIFEAYVIDRYVIIPGDLGNVAIVIPGVPIR